MHDLVIRGAMVIDGLGHDALRADVAIAGGRITAIGDVGNGAAKVVDAGGLTLMPGIIDIHTLLERAGYLGSDAVPLSVARRYDGRDRQLRLRDCAVSAPSARLDHAQSCGCRGHGSRRLAPRAPSRKSHDRRNATRSMSFSISASPRIFEDRVYRAVPQRRRRRVEPLVKPEAGVIALSDTGAHHVYLCDAGFGLYFLGHWVRERGTFDLVEGVRRLTSHQAALYGIPDRGRIANGACADLLLFDPATVGISPTRAGLATCPAAGRARCATRSACTGSSSTARLCSMARTVRGSIRARGACSIVCCRRLQRQWRQRRNSTPNATRSANPGAARQGHWRPCDAHFARRCGARPTYEGRIALMAPGAEVASVRELTINGPSGPLKIRIYTPHDAGPFPLLVFFHWQRLCAVQPRHP